MMKSKISKNRVTFMPSKKSKEMGRVVVKVGLANIGSDTFQYYNALIDTGADTAVIPKAIADKLKIKIIKSGKVDTANGPMHVDVGELRIKINNEVTPVRVWITDKISKILIGVIVLESLGLKVNPKKNILEEEQQILYYAR